MPPGSEVGSGFWPSQTWKTADPSWSAVCVLPQQANPGGASGSSHSRNLGLESGEAETHTSQSSALPPLLFLPLNKYMFKNIFYLKGSYRDRELPSNGSLCTWLQLAD